ncbi:hypothetical protein L9F63_019676, partial [Diploptera punctata]
LECLNCVRLAFSMYNVGCIAIFHRVMVLLEIRPYVKIYGHLASVPQELQAQQNYSTRPTRLKKTVHVVIF